MYMYVRVCTCMYVLCMYVCRHVCMCVCLHVSMYACNMNLSICECTRVYICMFCVYVRAVMNEFSSSKKHGSSCIDWISQPCNSSETHRLE